MATNDRASSEAVRRGRRLRGLLGFATDVRTSALDDYAAAAEHGQHSMLAGLDGQQDLFDTTTTKEQT